MEEFEKQSWEKFPIYGSILNVQDPTETVVLATSTVAAVDNAGADVSTTVLDSATKVLGTDPDGSYSDNMLGIKVQAGEEDKSKYKITFKMITSLGNQYEVDVKMKVKEQ